MAVFFSFLFPLFLHACFAKPFFEYITNRAVEEAYMHVHYIAERSEMYANDVQLAVNCDARGMDVVRAAPIVVPLNCDSVLSFSGCIESGSIILILSKQDELSACPS